MKTKTTMMLALMALGTSALLVSAQDSNSNNDGPSAGNSQRGPGMRGQRMPAPAIVRALDANHDGVIDADEIANASAALKTLDKNGDGKLTPDEFMGPPPQMRGGPNGGPGNRRPHNGAGGDDSGQPAGPPPSADDGGNNPPAGPPPDDN